jgi:hypothetical protein
LLATCTAQVSTPGTRRDGSMRGCVGTIATGCRT